MPRSAAPLVALLLLAVPGCLDPQDRRPGLRLSGPVAEELPDDWSFTDEHGEIHLEVSTPYLLPHSVTIVCTQVAGRLYVGARDPEEKRWPGYVADDPEVRLEIGERIYEVRLEPVEDPTVLEAVYRSYARKYGWQVQPPEERPPWRIFRVRPRDQSA